MEYLAIEKLNSDYFVALDVFDAQGNVVLSRETKLAMPFIKRLQQQQISHIWVTHQQDYEITPHSFPDQAHVKTQYFTQIFKDVSEIYALFKEYFIQYRKNDKYYFNQTCDKIRGQLRQFSENLQTALEQIRFPNRFPGYFLSSSPQNYKMVQRINGALLAAFFGEKWQLPSDLSFSFVLSQFFLDVGILPIPAKILEARRQLEPDELALLQKHPQIGSMALQHFSDILGDLPPLIALQHHEMQDGDGYPQKLKGTNQFDSTAISSFPLKRDELHPLSEISSIIDIFSALISFRPFRRPLTIQTALSLIRNLMLDTKVNSELFHHFESSLDHFPLGGKVIVLNGTYQGFEGIVVKQSQQTKNPFVLLIKNQEKELITPTEVDCSKWKIKLKQIF